MDFAPGGEVYAFTGDAERFRLATAINTLARKRQRLLFPALSPRRRVAPSVPDEFTTRKHGASSAFYFQRVDWPAPQFLDEYDCSSPTIPPQQ